MLLGKNAKSNKFNGDFVSEFLFLFTFFWIGAISAEEEDFLFPVFIMCYYFCYFILSSLWTTTSKPTCVCVCFFLCFEVSFFIWNSVFSSLLSRWFILGDVSIIHTYADLKKSVILFFGSYRVINVHKGVRTMSYLPPFLVLFTLSLKCVGFYFGVTSYFFLSFFKCTCTVECDVCVCICVCVSCFFLNIRNATSRYFMKFHFKNAYLV